MPYRTVSVPLHPDTVQRLGHQGTVPSDYVREDYDVASMRRDMLASTPEVCGPGPADVRITDVPPELLGMAARIYQPMKGEHPIAVALHGGGWVSGTIETHDAVWRRMAISDLAVVALDYPLSPESRYPEPLLAVERALSRIHDLSPFGVITDRVGLVGDSAGGNLAAALSNRASSGKRSPIAAQVLVYPVIDAVMKSSSYAEFGTGFGLTAQKMSFYWDEYCPGLAQRSEPDASPGLADDAVLAAAPPTLVITAECDVLRDESEQYAQRLASAGAEAFAVRYRGLSHGFFRMHAAFPAGAAATDQAAGFLAQRLRAE